MELEDILKGCEIAAECAIIGCGLAYEAAKLPICVAEGLLHATGYVAAAVTSVPLAALSLPIGALRTLTEGFSSFGRYEPKLDYTD